MIIFSGEITANIYNKKICKHSILSCIPCLIGTNMLIPNIIIPQSQHVTPPLKYYSFI